MTHYRLTIKQLLLGSIIACFGLPALHASAAVDQPNIVIIFTDDQGYGDLACFGGAEGYATPEIDRMAAEGMRFTDFHVAHSVCTPSRAALLTGRYPERSVGPGVFFPWSVKGLPPGEITLAEILKAEGYATACVGKWHLGHLPEFLPTTQGFDHYFGIPYSNDMTQDGSAPLAEDIQFNEGMTLENYREYQPHEGKGGKALYRKYSRKVPLMSGTEVIEWPVDQSQITRRFTEEAVEFIEANATKPFFLYLAHSMPHVPLFASERFKGSTERGLYGDVIEELDWSVGEILEALRAESLDRRTLVVFTSDNGPWLIMGKNGGSSGALRDGKGSSYEGGQRVPAVFWWPGKIPAGSTTDFNATTLDLLPTIANLAGAAVPQDRPIDGIDLRWVLAGQAELAEDRDFFIYSRGEAIRVGDWKYREGPLYGQGFPKPENADNPRVWQLFNLNEDPGEQNNRIDAYPEKAANLKKMLQTARTNLR